MVFIPIGIPALDAILWLVYQATNIAAAMPDLIYRTLVDMWTQVSNYVGNLMGGIVTRLYDMIGTITTVVRTIIQSVAQAMNSMLQPMLTAMGTMVDNVKTFIVGLLGQIKSLAADVWSLIVTKVGAALDYVRELAEYVTTSIGMVLTDTVKTVWEWINSATRGITDVVQAAIRAIAQTVIDISSSVMRILRPYIDEAMISQTRAIESINREWGKLMTGSSSLISGIGMKLGDVSGAMAKVVTGLTAGLKELTAAQKEAFAGISRDLLGYLKTVMPSENVTRDVDAIQALVGSPDWMQMNHSTAMGLWRSMIPTNVVARAAYLTLFSVAWGIQLYSGIGAEIADIFKQEWLATNTPTILSQSDVVASWRRGSLTKEEATFILARHGYKPGTADMLLESSQGPPSSFDLISMERRGLINDAQLDSGQRQAGIASEWRTPLYKLTEYIPPITDLIHMAVREAFSPAVAERFGQFEDYPSDLSAWAKMQGLSEDWARKYWAAHWSLPSAQQGFEMLHRGAASEADLDMLLRALDVMPFWRKPLKEIAYRPYTRVDIRRMHKVGVLSDEELEDAYTAIGYDPVKALKLAEFTRRLNKGTSLEVAPELGELTKSQILRFYAEGTIDAAKAAGMLVESGMTPEAARLFIASADLEHTSKERNTQALLIVEQAQAGALTNAQAEDQMRRLGLSELEVARKMIPVMRAASTRSKMPTRAEGGALYAAGIIAENEYRDLLGRIGYPDRWINAYVALEKAKSSRRNA
jgi:hypothetical protein